MYDSLNLIGLKTGAKDFRYLLDRDYPRAGSLGLVGDRYNLDHLHRSILHRGVFGAKVCSLRRSHRETPGKIMGDELALDGYNVLITVESSIRGIPVLLCDDGWVRDVAGVSGGYRFRDKGMQALELILEAVKALRPGRVLFLFDSPISRSGELASLVKNKLNHYNISGEAHAVPVPEKLLLKHRGPVATSDSALIDRIPRVVDLAGHVIQCSAECGETLDIRENV